MKYIHIPWCSNGYFDEHSLVDLLVHTTDNSFTIYNVTTDVSLGEDWLTCEVGHDHPRRGIYIPAKDICWIELIPNVPTPPLQSRHWRGREHDYNDLFGDEDATEIK